MQMLTYFFRGLQNENVDCSFYFFQRYAKWKCWLFVLFFSEVCRMKMLTLFYIFQRYTKWKCWLFVLFFSEVCRMKMLTVCFIFFRGMQNKNVDCFIFFRGMQNANVDLFFQRFAEWKCWLFILFFSEICRMKMLTVLFFSEVCKLKMLTLFYFFQRYAEWKCWLCFIFFRGMQNENVDCLFYFFQSLNNIWRWESKSWFGIDIKMCRE